MTDSPKERRFFVPKSRVKDLVRDDEVGLLDTAKSLAHKAKETYLPTKEETKGYTLLDWIGVFLPCVVWLRTYDIKNWLLKDVVAGLSVGAMVIPQGMSYANLAGLPYVFGLYGAFVPCLVYAAFGSSKQLAVGPVAVTSMLLGNGLAGMFDFVNQDPNNPTNPAAQTAYNHAAIQVAFIAGLMYTAVGLLRLGWLTNFLSHTTISGFMSGASITIALSQVKYILGLKLPRSDKIVESLEKIFQGLGDPVSWSSKYGGPGRTGGFAWQEFTMGMAFIFLLLVFRFLGARYKRLSYLKAIGPLTVCVISIALMNIFKWYRINPLNIRGGKAAPIIKPIGNIPSGMPPFTASWFFPLQNVSKQIVLSLLIALIDICESISIARAMAIKNEYRLNNTQELRALGFANLAGSLFSCYTTTGSFSRSAVNNSVGAKTLLSSFTTGILLMITLLVLTPVFENMSQNVQGAIIIVGVLQLVDFQEFLYLWKINKLDFVLWNTVFLIVLFLGVEAGIGVGVGLSLLLVIYHTAFPHIAVLGRLGDTALWRNIKMYPGLEQTPGILIIRVDAPIFYANVENIRTYITNKLEQAEKSGAERIRHLILDVAPAPDIDSSAIHFLNDFLKDLKKKHIKLVLANPNLRVLKALKRGGIIDKIGGIEAVHINIQDAVDYAQGQIDKAVRRENVEGV